ncbi:hypothetical protein [Magnetospirillum fulvum]|jgi:ABC-type Na+ efflux pump permease subunit|uniref:Uncharacterized protein n=1 Tax=Magnetospirillum fulvum TaxID=1082 RepID=A0A1H6H7F2_MAGFU|nr:hypothetical protein [Magnetospirillum fulvum]SEH31719.1 hypothetical protein SAMN04244559_01115 [Magnetospirillum fulvum]
MSEATGRELQSVEPVVANVPAERAINLAQSDVLNLSGLNDSQIAEIKRQHADGMVSVQVKAAEMKLDVTALDAALTSFTDQTAKASQAGAHATIQHSQTSSIGKTEVVIGNTDRAAAGKINSGSNAHLRTLLVVAVVAIAVVVLAGLFRGHP